MAGIGHDWLVSYMAPHAGQPKWTMPTVFLVGEFAPAFSVTLAPSAD